jgi:hypothetical protein
VSLLLLSLSLPDVLPKQVYSHGAAGDEAALLESVSLGGGAKLDPAGFVESLQSARALARFRKRLPQEQVPHVDLMAAWMGQVKNCKNVTVKIVSVVNGAYANGSQSMWRRALDHLCISAECETLRCMRTCCIVSAFIR